MRAFCLALVTLALCRAGSAQKQTVLQMQHSSWRGHDGAPQAINALAQTTDGVIWIASLGGLFHFDGISFERFQPIAGSPDVPSGAISSLLVSKSGDLWVFRFHGAPFRIHSGRVELSHTKGDATVTTIWHGHEDGRGRMVALRNDREIVELGAGNWWFPTRRFASPHGFVRELAMGGDGALWVAEDSFLHRYVAGRAEAQRLPIVVAHDGKIIPALDGTVWIMNRMTELPGRRERLFSLQHVDVNGRLLERPFRLPGIDDVLLARDGSLWVTAQNRGIWKMARGGARQVFREADAFVSAAADTLFEALDGTIWAGGTTGLDSFREARLVPARSNLHPGFWTSCAAPQTDVWLADDVRELMMLRDGQATGIREYRNDGRGAQLSCGDDGTVWLSDSNGIRQIRGGKLLPVAAVPGNRGGHGGTSYGGVTESGGKLVLEFTSERGEQQLWTYGEGRWRRLLPKRKLETITGLLLDRTGELYLAFLNGRLQRLTNEALSDITVDEQRQGFDIGFARTTHGLFAYGQEGLTLIEDGRGTRVPFFDRENAFRLTGVVEAANGDVWLNGNRGIVCVPAAEMRQFGRNHHRKVQSQRVYEGDYVGPDLFTFYRRSAHRDKLGTLWFSTLQGVVSVDPAKVFAASARPMLTVRSITSDQSLMNERREFPAGTSHIDIKYFGLYLRDPRSVAYRYYLEGADQRWHNAGQATETTYDHLRPGRYTFRVMAASSDGRWTAPIHSLPFRIRPHPWQTWPFWLLTGAALLWLAWLLFQRRLHATAMQARALAEERADERTRIARELHDTLLQGIQGLLLNFSVVKQRILQGAEVAPLLEKSLQTAESLVVEGRERVGMMRNDASSGDSLAQRLQRLCGDLRDDTGVDIEVAQGGTVRELNSGVADELFYIAREALTNALRHARAKKIRVQLNFGGRLFQMECRDDGVGFEPAGVTRSENRRTQWGLQGMKERAGKIQGRLDISSQPGRGTQVTLKLDARFAYAE